VYHENEAEGRRDCFGKYLEKKASDIPSEWEDFNGQYFFVSLPSEQKSADLILFSAQILQQLARCNQYN
jgi:hypothetical protein